MESDVFVGDVAISAHGREEKTPKLCEGFSTGLGTEGVVSVSLFVGHWPLIVVLEPAVLNNYTTWTLTLTVVLEPAVFNNRTTREG